MHFRISIFFILTLYLLSSCNPGKNLSTSDLKDRNPNYILKRLDKEAFDSQWLSGKARMFIDYKGQSVSASLSLRMERDQTIWAQVKKFNFEVGRLKITQDSVFLVDRLNKRYLAENIDELSQLLNCANRLPDAPRPRFWQSILLVKGGPGCKPPESALLHHPTTA